MSESPSMAAIGLRITQEVKQQLADAMTKVPASQPMAELRERCVMAMARTEAGVCGDTAAIIKGAEALAQYILNGAQESGIPAKAPTGLSMSELKETVARLVEANMPVKVHSSENLLPGNPTMSDPFGMYGTIAIQYEDIKR